MKRSRAFAAIVLFLLAALFAFAVGAQAQEAAEAAPEAPPAPRLGEGSLRVRVVNLEGRPLPGARVWAEELGGEGAAVAADAQGVAVIEGLPDAEVHVRAAHQVPEGPEFRGLRQSGPGETVLALPDAGLVSAIEQDPLNPDRPVWKASHWLAGEPVTPDRVREGGWFVACVRPSSLATPQEILDRILAVHRRHSPDGLKTAIVLAQGLDMDEAAFRGVPALSVGVDAPVLPEEGAPGYTESLYSAVDLGGALVFGLFVGFDGNVGGALLLREPEDVGTIVAQADDWMEPMPPARTLVPVGPDGAPAEGARAMVLFGEEHWAEITRDAQGRLRAFDAPDRSPAAVVAWRAEDDLVGAAPVEGDGPVRVEMAQGFAVEGRFVSQDGQPLEGVKVRMRVMHRGFAHYAAADAGYGTAVSDPDGAFAIRSAPYGMHIILESEAVGLAPWTRTVRVGAGEPAPALGDIRLQLAERTVRGVVVAADGTPLQGAVATLQDGRTARTDDEGRFRFENAPRGPLVLNVAAQRGTDHVSQTLHLPEDRDYAAVPVVFTGEGHFLQMTLPPLRAEWVLNEPPDDLERHVRYVYFVERERREDHAEVLRAFDAMARRYAGRQFAAAVLYPQGTDPEEIRAEQPEGMAALVGVDKEIEPGAGVGWTEAFRQARGHGHISLSLADRGGMLAMQLHPRQGWNDRFAAPETVEPLFDAVDVELTAFGPNGRPVAGASVVAAALNFHLYAQQAVTDEEGRLSLPALRSTRHGQPIGIVVYHLERKLAGYAEAQAEGDERKEIAVRLAPPPPVEGRVVDRHGQPLARARVQPNVQIQLPGAGAPLRPAPPVRTGTNGAYRFDWIPPQATGQFTVNAPGHYHETVPLAPARPGEGVRNVADAMLHLADQEARFTVLDLEGQPLAGVTVNAGGRAARTDAQGEATVTGLPDKPVPVSISGARGVSGRFELGPGEHVVAAVSNEQRQRLMGVLRGQDGPPLWQAERWVQGEPFGPDAAVPWLAVVPAETLTPEDLLRLAEAMGAWRREHGARVRRFALVLPVGTSDEAAAAVAERATGVAVAADMPVAPGAGVGYSQAVQNALGGPGAFRAYLNVPQARRTRIQMIPAFGDMDNALRTAEQMLRRHAERLPVAPEAVLDTLRETGEVVREEQDAFSEGRTWIIMRQGLATLAEGEEVQQWTAVLGMDGFRVSGLAFAERMVYAGTDQGLIAYSRATGAWNRIAPAGDYELIAAPVESVEQREGRIEAVFRPEGQAVRRYVLEDGVWRRR